MEVFVQGAFLRFNRKSSSKFSTAKFLKQLQKCFYAALRIFLHKVYGRVINSFCLFQTVFCLVIIWRTTSCTVHCTQDMSKNQKISNVLRVYDFNKCLYFIVVETHFLNGLSQLLAFFFLNYNLIYS